MFGTVQLADFVTYEIIMTFLFRHTLIENISIYDDILSSWDTGKGIFSGPPPPTISLKSSGNYFVIKLQNMATNPLNMILGMN